VTKRIYCRYRCRSCHSRRFRPTWRSPLAHGLGGMRAGICIDHHRRSVLPPLHRQTFLQAILSPATFSFPFRDNTVATSTCGTTGPLYATSNQICTTPLRDATTGSLCAPHGSPENPITGAVAAHMLLEDKAVLIQDPNLTLRDATTTVLNISLPPLNPSASMRAWQAG